MHHAVKQSRYQIPGLIVQVLSFLISPKPTSTRPTPRMAWVLLPRMVRDFSRPINGLIWLKGKCWELKLLRTLNTPPATMAAATGQ